MVLPLESLMITTKGSAVIEVPIEVVFDFLADVRNEARWLPGASNIRLTSDEPIREGSTFVGTYARAGEVAVRVTQYERPSRLTLAGDARNLSFTDEITLRPAENGTALVALMTTQPKGLFRIFAPVMGRVIGKQFQANWDSLKATLEADHVA
jgi:carbon monoxide dehydrogenase subunit G